MKNILHIVFIALISFQTYAQSSVFSSNKEEDAISLKERNEDMSLMNAVVNDRIFENKNSLSNEGVFLTQIGNNNNSKIHLSATHSKLRLFQNGEYNDIEIDVNAVEVIDNIYQIGNDNSVVDKNYRDYIGLSKLQVIQKGNNLTLESYGINAITNRLKFKMTGANKTIIINSF